MKQLSLLHLSNGLAPEQIRFLRAIGDYRFDGVTYDQECDGVRLSGQLVRVWAIISDGQWKTLNEIRESILFRFSQYDSEAGISARLRDFRKDRFGGWVVIRRRRGPDTKGLWEYRILVPPSVWKGMTRTDG